MALPEPGAAWPPKNITDIHDTMAIWSAWYSNEVAQLGKVYGGNAARRGLLNRVASWFWTPKDNDRDAGMAKLHVPVASDLCQVSADLLFSEPPAVMVDDPKANTKAQERLEMIAGAGFDQTMTSFAEVSAALGGGYLRITWDSELYDHVFITKVDADGAIPEFRYGRLTAVTFWRVVGEDGQRVFRHLERHEQVNGIGVIIHGLYEGTLDKLGNPRALADHDATKHLADVVDAESMVSTDSPGLAVCYAPNIGPNRRWRLHPHGANLGRSDLDGIEPLMDALDRVYSSLMRDIELGKGRALVAASALTDLGPGKGASFDSDKAFFTGLNIGPASMAEQKFPVEVIQFKIRVTEHLEAAAAIYGQIIRTAGYSAQTFGEKSEAGAGDVTATEVTSKERRSYLTRGRKIRNLKPELEKLLTKALVVDAAVFGTGVTEIPVTVTFADAVEESMESLARTAQLLRGAEAAATKTLVAMVHPDWDETAVDEEVGQILAERKVFPDPIIDGTEPLDDGGTDGAGTLGSAIDGGIIDGGTGGAVRGS